MPATTSATVPESEVEAAYASAMRYARWRRKRFPYLSVEIHDAATDAVMWSLANYLPDAGGFGAFCYAAVARFCWNRIAKAAQKHHTRPAPVAALHDGIPARDRRHPPDAALPLELSDLPPDEAAAARLYILDGFDLRECGLLLGCSPETVRVRLGSAADRLSPGAERPARRKNEKRLAAG